jgi:hypothetical protein
LPTLIGATVSRNDQAIGGQKKARHRTCLPIICQPKEGAPGTDDELQSIGPNGLTFSTTQRHPPGTRLDIAFPWMKAGSKVKAEVGETVRTMESVGKVRHVHELRLLDDSEAIMSTLIETIQQIEEYRKDQASQGGRNLTPRQAAEEWAVLSRTAPGVSAPSKS